MTFLLFIKVEFNSIKEMAKKKKKNEVSYLVKGKNMKTQSNFFL